MLVVILFCYREKLFIKMGSKSAEQLPRSYSSSVLICIGHFRLFCVSIGERLINYQMNKIHKRIFKFSNLMLEISGSKDVIECIVSEYTNIRSTLNYLIIICESFHEFGILRCLWEKELC